MKKISFLIITTVVCISGAHAQTPDQIGQVEMSQTYRANQMQFRDGDSAPALYEGEESDVGPQTVLRLKPRKTLLEVIGDAQIFRTDNMLLTDRDPFGSREREKVDAVVFVATAEIALAPTPYSIADGKLAPRFGYRHQWFLFGLDDKGLRDSGKRLSEYDFNAQTVFADLRWSRDNWIFEGGVSGMRLMTSSEYAQFYQELLPYLRVRRVLPVNDRMAFSAGYEGNYHFTDSKVEFFPYDRPNVNNRTDQMLFANYTHVICPKAVFQPYYRVKYTHYTQFSAGARNDLVNSFGASLYWLACPNFNVRLFAGYDIKNSDNDRASEYRKLDLGGGVNVSFRF